MKHIENANDKIQLICEQIKNDALEPAKQEAKLIVENAKKEAELIKSQLLKEIEEEKAKALSLIEQEKLISQTALQLAGRQSIDKLKSEIINIFNDSLSDSIEDAASKTDVVLNLINSVCESLVKEGIYSPIQLTIGKKVALNELADKLSKDIKEKLAGGPLSLGAFASGAELKLQGKNLTIDISDKAVKELFSTFLKRPDFRALIFKE